MGGRGFPYAGEAEAVGACVRGRVRVFVHACRRGVGGQVGRHVCARKSGGPARWLYILACLCGTHNVTENL